jgi:cytochrome c553
LPPVTGEALAHTCAGCHGTQGRLADEAFVPLAGMPAASFVQTMQDFRSGRRPATLMGHIARGLSDAEFQSMAAYFERQVPAPGSAAAPEPSAPRSPAMKRRQFLQCTAAACTATLGLGWAGAARAQGTAGRVVVVGGGVGGATAAKYLKLFNPALQVTLIERNATYVRPYGSSEVLNGHATMASLDVSYDALRSRHGVQVLIDTVTGLDATRRQVITASGSACPTTS